MKYKVIIPARGGSKGLVNKNILPINGKPLINYTIDAAKEIFSIDQIFVSTDSENIKKVVEKNGLNIRRMRPSYLAKDNSTTIDVLFDFIENECDKDDSFLVLLQPTSPLRSSNHIREALDLVNDNIDMVVSVKVSHENPYWNLFEENEFGYLSKSKKGDFLNRQSIPNVYAYNGAIYIININSLIKYRSLNFPKIVKYVMDKPDSIDIDDILDFKIAEYLISNNAQS